MQDSAPMRLGENKIPAERMEPPKHVVFEERRRTARVRLSISILVGWDDASGKQFSEQTRTEVVAGNGASLILPQNLSPGTVITISSKVGKANARIVGQVGVVDGGYVYGVAFLDEGCQRFWGVTFPPLADDEAPSLTLECSGCSRTEEVHLDVVEGMVYDANRVITKWCEPCQRATSWRNVQLLADAQFVTSRVGVADEIQQLKPPPRGTNERKHPRITMRNARACIARPGEDGDVVDVQDLSRGGVRFSSFVNYQIGTWVRVAVPFIEGTSNIFVEGRIVRVHSRPNAGCPGEFAIQFKA